MNKTYIGYMETALDYVDSINKFGEKHGLTYIYLDVEPCKNSPLTTKNTVCYYNPNTYSWIKSSTYEWRKMIVILQCILREYENYYEKKYYEI